MARASRASWVLSSALLLAACAHGTGAERSDADRDAAQRIYMVAEERYAAGDYANAVALMRHALLQLPSTADYDDLRHELVLRMAHTQLRDHAATGHPAPLHDAKQMLERYVVRHEQLFGESDRAREERGEAYELLALVDQRLDPVTVDYGDAAPATPVAVEVPASAATPEAPVAGSEVTAALEVPEPPAQLAVATPVAPSRTIEVDDGPAVTRTAQRVDDEGNEVRDLVVSGKRRRPSVDDPAVRAKLASPFTTGWLGGVMTAYGVTKMRDARPLVRGQSRLAGSGDLSQHLLARRAGQSLLRSARQGLRDCYAAAYARQPVDALESAVEASVHPDGSISHVRIVDGGLVDGYGDACLIEALQATAVAPLGEESVEPVRVQVALVFFYEGALYINEGTGEQTHEGGVMLSAPAPRLPGLPAINRMVRRDPTEAIRVRR